MFKLAVFAAILAVAFAKPGGLTGIGVSHGTVPIVGPSSFIAITPALAIAPGPNGNVIAQPLHSAVHSVLKTDLLPHVGPLALHN